MYGHAHVAQVPNLVIINKYIKSNTALYKAFLVLIGHLIVDTISTTNFTIFRKELMC